MDAETQFNAVAALIQRAIQQADDRLVPVDTLQHILRVTKAQAEMAAQGLLEKADV